MNTTNKNLENLTSLWQLAGTLFDSYTFNKFHSASTIQNSEWPNKIWINNRISTESLKAIKEEMIKNQTLTFSNFDNGNNQELFINDSFELKFIQHGMSLALEKPIHSKRELNLIKVENKDDAKLWSITFKAAFNYNFSEHVVMKLKNKTNFYLVYDNEKLVGCVLIFHTDKTAGVHCLGILPNQRKQGYAYDIMVQLINDAINMNYKLMTLQASDMAKNIYSKLGFIKDFTMENYKLKQ
ncbi:GNAT family N-acetyltransferase [Seonamhaeicola marinus]|uniref:GNAT family N-acetyltransferase n=1 Tax=Seonamhaeicola marinus TaxID=1912246 RepID=A0A5D0I6M2_9FLAO|nr:GNAT family N-acetyltransferase [Seonamhaeicola marinus]TYA78579.1 GNAT family N-acetyltransferase [Seonamhaeicola marinus]